jgi:hypothetical protein
MSTLNRASHKNSIVSWCIPSYVLYLQNGSVGENKYRVINIPTCRNGCNCYNAHFHSQIKLKPNIQAWNRPDKSDFNLYTTMEIVKSKLTLAREVIRNQKFLTKIQLLHTMSFNELLAFWYEVACFHRRISKELPSKKFHKSSILPEFKEGFRFKEDIYAAECYLDDIEDDVWALERTLHCCPKHSYVLENKDKIINAFDLCPGDMNCKLGVHENENEACIDDMITGSCKCSTIEEINKLNADNQIYNNTIAKEISSLKTQLNSSIDADGFEIKLSKKVRAECETKIKELESQFRPTNFVRKIHYTEQKMVCLNKLIEINRLKSVAVDSCQFKVTKTIAPIKKKIINEDD